MHRMGSSKYKLFYLIMNMKIRQFYLVDEAKKEVANILIHTKEHDN